MKLIIQIPCYNEEACLPITLNELPREIEGIDKVEWLIIDDGSTDNSVQIAKKYGVDYIVSFKKNQGLAKVFMAGIEESIKQGADIIVNTDADNQYNANDISKLVKQILDNKAEIVIGERPLAEIEHFSSTKKLLSRFGSWVMKNISKTDIEDAPSGFRAFSRKAALSLNVFSNYTYTMETIILAGVKKIKIVSIPIRVNEKLRNSKLISSIPRYIRKSVFTMIRTLLIYKSVKFTFSIGALLTAIAITILFFTGFNIENNLTLLLFFLGSQMFIVSLIMHILSAQRFLLENIQSKVREMESNMEKLKSNSNLDAFYEKIN